MKKIAVKVQNSGNLTIDLGGDLDNGCCGGEAGRLNNILKEYGLEVNLQSVFCRLPTAQRVAAKFAGKCNTEREKTQ